MEKKMETTRMGYIGIMEKKMETARFGYRRTAIRIHSFISS